MQEKRENCVESAVGADTSTWDQYVNLTRDAFVLQERVLSAEDCELIHGGATRRQRCTSLLTVLASKPAACAPAAALLCALATKYAFIVERCAPRISPGEADFYRQGGYVE